MNCVWFAVFFFGPAVAFVELTSICFCHLIMNYCNASLVLKKTKNQIENKEKKILISWTRAGLRLIQACNVF